MSRTIYLGTSPFAATVLRRLATTPHRPALVITPPDRRKGRGRKELPPPAALAATELGMELLQTSDTSEPAVLERIRSTSPEALVVCAFGQIIREPLLSEHEILNVHPSLLPRWRGAAPIERALMAGDATTGICVMRLVEELDAGPVTLREEIAIEPDEDYGSLAERLAALGGDLLVEALDALARGDLRFTEQAGEATYAEKIERSERLLSPKRDAIELERTVRALTPHIGAQFELEGGERLGVRRASATAEEVGPGEVAERDGALVLGCAEGALAIDVVQSAGGRAMPAAEYLRGHPVPRLAGGG